MMENKIMPSKNSFDVIEKLEKKMKIIIPM
jgi:hypothetical protein